MIQNNINIISVAKTARRTAMGCLLLFFMAGSLMAQNDTPFVIKKGGNYLAHVKVGDNYVLQNAATFDPSTCLWYSGPTHNPTGYTHNYYFEDDAHNQRFLAAPLQPNGTLSLSSSLPSVSLLRNTDQIYYFYNWDPETNLSGVPEGGGLAKGHRYYVNTQEECEACGDYDGATWYVDPDTGLAQCWEAYWIEYDGTNWKLSSTSSYLIPSNAARYRKVTVTAHEKEINAGGLTTLTAPSEMNFEEHSTLSAPVSSPYSYIPAYTHYVFLESGSESVHNYWGNSDHLTATPTQVENVNIVSKSYEWTISGEGQSFLSFNSGSDVNTTTDETPTLYYRLENETGHKVATITVSVTYTDANNEQTSQTRSATVLVKTSCRNPLQDVAPVITYTGVTVSWLPTADTYKVFWKNDDPAVTTWDFVEVGNVTSYTITGLEYETEYLYKVTTDCGTNTPIEYPFTTVEEPGLMVGGAIFGGGRVANVGGKTEVVVVNCDSIGAIYGGNDIAGSVLGGDGSIIKLGVNSGDSYDSYGVTPNVGKIRVTSVYGGGNGYYAYNGTSFVAATEDYTSETVAAGGSVNAMTQSHTVGDVVWTNTSSSPKTLNFPSIVKTAITVTNNQVKVDSIFGGAKNAFLTTNSDDGSLITINGGTILAVFGGNNFGGDQGYGNHHIVVNGTTTNLTPNITNTATTGYGRSFGIGDLFGGGNKVYGSTTNIEIFGGQTDNVFGGGNSADVYAANVTVACSLDAYNDNYPYTYGNTYTNAIPTSYQGGAISIVDDYSWDGKGVYNVRNLYGGNNMESMAGVPTVTLTSGSVGTVYGGGNAGDMLASSAGTIDEDGDNTPDISFNYSTKVILNSANIIVDYLYGGCRMSNVDYSTWVQIQNGHVGTVFGGCNVSGDVGSTRVNPTASSGADYQEVQGSTYVEASGGIVYKNLFAGGNGFYHCNENFHYVGDINYTNENFVGMIVPTHNETYANVRTGATIRGNVYAGGNLAPVGFRDYVAPYFPSFPTNAVGWAVVHIYGGTVEGNVFGGGNMADVYGSNDVLVAGGSISALYGGNDRTGQVAEFSNRVLPDDYTHASDGSTLVVTPGPEVHAYVRVVGNPDITEVYGGGNGDYDYEHGDEVVPQYCSENESGPIQSNTFVDIHIDGGVNGGHIGTVYGGGDGVTASGFITVFINIIEPNPAEDHVNVGTVFGGNNKGDLNLVPDIILLHGQVGTVYGGCNEGAMTASTGVEIGGYQNIGSYVHLRDEYRPNGTGDPVTPTIKVDEAVYGGCRMNGVTNNSLVLVEGGDFSSVPIYGGSDISGNVGGTSRVVVTDGTVGNVYGGGNGDYEYPHQGATTPPSSVNSGVDIVGGTVVTGIYGGNNAKGIISGDIVVNVTGGTIGASTSAPANIHGGGYGSATQTQGNVTVNIGATTGGEHPTYSGTAVINGNVYGGSALGQVSASNKLTQVNFYKGTINGDVYGGALGNGTYAAEVSGDVEVNIRGGVFNGANGTLGGGRIFGCNNANGTPKGNVNVNIYATDHGADFEHNLYPTAPSEGWTVAALATNALTQTYAISAVYGGGNEAAYQPVASKSATVHVYNCDNTIQDVYGGGNAADMGTTGEGAISANTFVIIDGGRINRVFGGGNGAGTGNPGANIYGTATTIVKAGLIDQVFGGGNELGTITATNLTVNHSESGCDEVLREIFGGGNLAPIVTNTGVHALVECGTELVGDIYGGSNMAQITGDVTLDIKGGTFNNVFGGSKGETGGTAANIDGNVKLNLQGGKIINAFGGSNYNGNITRNIIVNVVDLGEPCGLQLTNVYGGGNETAYNPTDATITSPVVNVIHIAHADGISNNVFGGAKGSTATVKANPKVNIGYDETSMSGYVTGLTLPATRRAYVKGSVFGGGDLADVDGNIEVNIFNGEVVHKVVGGGNSVGATGVTGNVTVNISGGNLCTSTDIDHVGIYGGCNESGTVGGEFGVTLNITGTAVIGTEANVSAAKKPVNVHGGGFGQGTSVTHNVLVNYGDLDAEESEYPKLFGDLYGGSALGSVNTRNTDNTIVNVLNGSIISITETVNAGQPNAATYYYSGNVYGGGLGQKEVGTTPGIPAVVNGTVYVNIGSVTTAPSTGLEGKATLIGCNVYGCNNKNGSPQGDVYVDVYQTAHTTANLVSGTDYAILHVFGGGNEAHYAPENNNPFSQKKTHLYVHGCDNTIKYSYGGGNAADAVGVQTIIEGGRFNEVYGGGNGLVTAANIGEGSVGFIILAGHVNFLFEGSNKDGLIGGTPYVPDLPEGYINCGILIVDSYYFGDNEAEHIGDIVNTITCEQASQFNYKYVYAGSRWAVVYGDVKLTVQGGNIRYLFGGSKGYLEDHIPADIRMFPSLDDIDAMNAIHPGYYSTNLRNYVEAHPDVVGKGGNIELIINGGTIGEVIGGCDELGNVEGKITVIVDEIGEQPCPLFVGNVFGANFKADITSIYTNPDGISTPKVNIIKGQIGGPPVTFNYDPANEPVQFEGNVFGGGDEGDVTCNPKVIIGDGTSGTTATPVTIKGNVFGGGNQGNVNGSSKVIIVPNTHKLTFDNQNTTGGTFTVSYSRGTAVTSGDDVGEDVDLVIEATPTPATDQGGYLFNQWSVTPTGTATSEGGATVGNPNSTRTLFTMGTENVTLSASFTEVSSYLFTLVSEPGGAGTFTVNGVPWSGSGYLAEGSTVSVHAIHAQGYIFKEWTVTGASLSNPLSATTSFVVEGPVTLTAHFVPVYDLTLESDPTNAFTFKVNGSNYTGPVSLKHGDRVTVEAVPATGVTFDHWTCEGEGAVVGNSGVSVTSFTMGTEDAVMTAHPNGRRTNNNRNTRH